MKKAFCDHFDSKSTSHLTRTRVVLLYYFLCIVSEVTSDLITPLPQNKAVVNGATRVAFNCTSTPEGQAAIGWSVLRVGESTQRAISNGNSVFPGYVDAYELSQTGSLTSTLIIKTVNESLAGTYFCMEAGVSTASAQLIVYNSDPVCTSNVSPGQNLTAAQWVQMSCSFSYKANYSYVGVNMVWSKVNPSSSVQNTTVFPIDGRAVSTITQIVLYSSPFPVYQCQTSFIVTGTTATNDPGYNYTAQPFSSPINVLYFYPNCFIRSNSGVLLNSGSIYYGASIRCQSNGNPPPTFRWSIGTTNATFSDTASVQITSDGQYNCTASSSVGRCTKSITLTTYTTTVPPTTSTTTTITPPFTTSQTVTPSTDQSQSSVSDSPSDTNKLIIGVVVGIGGFIVLILLTVMIICWRIRKNKSSEKTKKNGQIAGENLNEVRLTTDQMRENANQRTENNTGTYEMLTDRSGQSAQIYTQLQPSGEENPAMNTETYEALTNRTDDYEHEYGRLRIPWELDHPAVDQ